VHGIQKFDRYDRWLFLSVSLSLQTEEMPFFFLKAKELYLLASINEEQFAEINLKTSKNT
jgi:hypothetical protein